MKKSIAAMTVLSFLTICTMAQPPAPPHRPDGRGPLPPPPGEQKAQATTTYTGQAGDWVTNPDYVYDGFYLQTSGTRQLVKFAPPLGQQLQAAVKNGSTITVKGVAHTTPEGNSEIRLVSLNAGGKTIADTAIGKPPTGTPPAEATVSGSGKITSLQKGRNGETTGLILDNKTILRMPPHIAAQLDSSTAAGTTVSYSGNKKAAREGEVSTGNYTIIHATAFTINGKEVQVR